MRLFFNKDKFIRVITFYGDKSSRITYHKRNKFKPSYLINPNHIFMANGYSTIVASDTSPETINPLDFKSKYDISKFQSAINNKVIEDTFSNLKSKRYDLTQILLFISLLCNAVVLFIVLKLAEII
jgi:hypothetical protein